MTDQELLELDQKIAEIEGFPCWIDDGCVIAVQPMPSKQNPSGAIEGVWFPSRNWSQGGPLIEKHDIALNHRESWEATIKTKKPALHVVGFGETHLIAAMRAIAGYHAMKERSK